MLRKLQALSPAFLKRLDHHLLINYPVLWATKLHQILFVSLLFFVLFSIKALVTPLSLQDLPDPDIHFGLTMIPIAAIIALWGIRVYQFKPEKSFGQKTQGQWLKEQTIYALGIFMLLSGPVAYNMILTERIDNKISDKQFSHDVFILDMGSEYYLNDGRYPNFGRNNLVNKNYRIDREEFSTEGLDFSIPSQLNEQGEHIQLLIETYNRYSKSEFPFSPLEVYDHFKESNSRYKRLNTDKVRRQVVSNTLLLSQIKTDRTLLRVDGGINGLLMMVLFVCLAFSIFQQASWKQFLMALGSAAVGGILIGLASEFLDQTIRGTRDEDWAMLLGAGMYGILLTQIFGNRNSRLMAAWRGVAVIVVALCFPILSMFFMVWSDMIGDPTDKGFTFVLFFLAGASYMIWNGLFRRRLDTIQASPTKN